MTKKMTWKPMKFQVYMKKEIRASRRWDGPQYPSVYYNEREVSRDDKGLTIEFEIRARDTSIPERLYLAVNKKNYKNLAAFAISCLSYEGGWNLRSHTGLLSDLVKHYGFGFEDTFTMERDVKGFGFMGGPGCGTKIHHLTYDKVTGVKPGLPEVVDTLAHLWFGGLTSEALHTRKDHKHLRDRIKEEDIYVTFGAYPGCQRTVAGWAAQGYPVKNGQAKDITCAKCAKHKEG